MSFPPRLRPLAAAVAALVALPASAQPEVVPAEHSVYAFLLSQRVEGRLPGYRHEALPMSRGAVQRHLDHLDDAREAFSNTTRYWLDEYLREFFEPDDGIESVAQPGALGLPLGRDTEKYLLHYRDDDWRVVLSAAAALQFRTADDSVTLRGAALVPTVATQGNYREVVGWYSSTFNGLRVGGDTRVLQRDPALAPLYYIGRQEIPPGSFDRTTASLRAGNRTFFAEIAHERLRVGAAADRPLMVADGSDYFSFLRAGLDTRVVQYQFIHAALGERSRDVPGDSGFVLTAPERYMALHRVQVDPIAQLSLGFTEAVVYGQRGPELAYLNPLFPIKPAEHALWDRDNALFALDAVARPVPGVEAYATILADDLDFSRLGQQSFNNKWAAQAGLALGADRFIPGATLWTEYTRVGPFVYTHRFELDGSFYNSYIHNGFGIGHPIGPNADQAAAGVRLLLPARARLDLTARYSRRGENYFDIEGRFVNVGGDVRDGSQPGFEIPGNVFLAGRRFSGPGARLEGSWEPVREAGLRLYADFQKWSDAPDEIFLRAELFVDL